MPRPGGPRGRRRSTRADTGRAGRGRAGPGIGRGAGKGQDAAGEGRGEKNHWKHLTGYYNVAHLYCLHCHGSLSVVKVCEPPSEEIQATTKLRVGHGGGRGGGPLAVDRSSGRVHRLLHPDSAPVDGDGDHPVGPRRRRRGHGHTPAGIQLIAVGGGDPLSLRHEQQVPDKQDQVYSAGRRRKGGTPRFQGTRFPRNAGRTSFGRQRAFFRLQFQFLLLFAVD